VKPRVVSLLSSATEIVDALGALDLLIGRSHECDYPPAVLPLPVCTKPLIDVNADSRAIDQQVRTSARNAISIYEVFDSVLEQLQPTHILTQVQCGVCAPSLRDVERSIARRLASAPKIVALNPCSLADIWDDFRRVGHALDVDAEPVISALQHRMRPFQPPHKPNVACIEWIEPLMVAGNWTPELIQLAGAIDVFGSGSVHSLGLSREITWENLTEQDPDVIIVAPCGFDIARTRAEMHWLASRPHFDCLKAVQSNRLFLADGNRFFNRPGPRVAETVDMIRHMAHGNAGCHCDQWAWTVYSTGSRAGLSSSSLSFSNGNK
jgi:iron complex transport system substrate-binding protein